MTKVKWTLDPNHSDIQLKVKHLAIANVTGRFKTFSGSVQSDNEQFEHAAVQVELMADSLDTNNAERDKHLRSDLFLNAGKFPVITFTGKVAKANEGYELRGDLTIMTTTKAVTLHIEHTGTGTGRFNDVRAGFEVSGKISRKDFGLNFNLLNEAGNLVVGEEIKIQCEVELMRD